MSGDPSDRLDERASRDPFGGVDAERIAALLDGRLPPDERAEVMARLEASPEGSELLADAIAALGDAGAERADATTDVRPLDTSRSAARRPWSPPTWLLLAAAAVLVGVMAIPVALRGRRDVAPTSPREIVAALSLGAPIDEWARPAWREIRGAGGVGVLSDRGRGVRVGARVAELEMLLATPSAPDSAIRIVATRTAELLDAYPGGSSSADRFRDIASSPAPRADTASVGEAAAAAARFAGARELRAGAWLEAARVAAARRQAGFFRARTTRGAIAGARELAAGDAAASDALRRVRRLVDAPSRAIDWPALNAAIDAALRALAD